MKEVQSRDWQYLIESVITLVEHDESELRPISKSEKKVIKSMKHNYKVARRVYNSIYSNIAEQFKIYLDSLASDEIDEIENDFRVNGNALFSVRDAQSVTKLLDSFAMFYYINSRLPYTTGHLFVPDGEILPGIKGEKLNLKELFAKFFCTKLTGLVSALLLGALLLFFCRQRNYCEGLPYRIVWESHSGSSDHR